MSDFVKKLALTAVFTAALSSSAAFGRSGALPEADAPVAQETIKHDSVATPKQPVTDAVKVSLPAIRVVGPVSVFSLENGLNVIVIPNHRAPVVTQMVWYRVGSADEEAGHTGIAHFLEHLMFKGTTLYPGDEFSRLIARIGGEQNAFTSYDYTGYYQSVASDYLEDVMKREADRMENLILSDEVIAPERQVIIEERRMRTDNSPSAMLGEETRATLFLNSPYRNPVIGWKQEMETLTREDAIAFYNRFYTPNNATLIIAGDVTPEKVRDLALATYGKVKRRAEPGNRVRPQEPVSRTTRSVTMRDPRVSEQSYQQYWVVPSYHNGAKGQAEALDLLGEILGGGSRSRLYQKLVVDKKMAASVGSAYSGIAVDDGVFIVYGMPTGKTSLEELRQAVDLEIADIAKNGVSDAELEQARKRFTKSMVYSLDNPSGMAQIYGAAVSTGMSVESVNNWADNLKAVKANDIKEAAKRYLNRDRGVVSRLLPEGKPANTDKPAARP